MTIFRGRPLRMRFCPYLGTDVPDHKPWSKEHIIPYAIGGSNDFVIYVSKDGNDKAGAGADAELVDSWPMQQERRLRRLVSTSGNHPRFKRKGEATFEGIKIPLQIVERAGGASATVQTTVYHEASPDGAPGRRVIAGTEAKMRTMLQVASDRQVRQGGEPLDIEGILQGAIRGEVDLSTSRAKASFGMRAGERCFVKMALAVGHMVLGERFSRTADADRLRRIMMEPDPHERDELGLLGAFSRCPGDIPGALSFLSDGDKHVVCLRTVGDMTVFSGLLFGGFGAVLPISRGVVYPEVPHASGRVFVVDPSNRSLREYSLVDFLGRSIPGRDNPTD